MFSYPQTMQLWVPEAAYEQKTVSHKNVGTSFFGGIVFSHPWGAWGTNFKNIFFRLLNIPQGSQGIPGIPGGPGGVNKQQMKRCEGAGAPEPLSHPGIPGAVNEQVPSRGLAIQHAKQKVGPVGSLGCS